jgi:DNA-binding XRE family transcriptional regulator
MTEEQGTRLKELRTKRGFETAADAARAHGWPVTTYQAHENGSRGLKLDIARRYAKAFGSTAAYILTGSKAGHGAAQPVVNHVGQVNVVATVSAGTFRYDDTIDEGIVVPAVLRADIPASSQYAARIDGPSVNKRIPDGAFAICALYESYPGGAQHGQLVHVVRERAGFYENTIKELRYTRDGAELWPVSTDPKHQQPIKLASGDDGEIVRIQGVVIGIYQPL